MFLFLQLAATCESVSILDQEKHQEFVLKSDLPSTETSFKLSGVAFTGNGKSTSVFGGAKYMCSDIIQIIIPKNSCKNTRKENIKLTNHLYSLAS